MTGLKSTLGSNSSTSSSFAAGWEAAGAEVAPKIGFDGVSTEVVAGFGIAGDEVDCGAVVLKENPVNGFGGLGAVVEVVVGVPKLKAGDGTPLAVFPADKVSKTGVEVLSRVLLGPKLNPENGFG